MKKQENIDYCLGNALMEERGCQAKWVISQKMEQIEELLQEIKNIMENEL